MIRSVLFDLDGTLIDTWELYIEAYVGDSVGDAEAARAAGMPFAAALRSK